MTAVNYQQMMTGGSQKKKKKQPFNPYAGGSSTPAQQPQTYSQPSMAQAQGQDPLVSAIAAGSQAQNQQPTMAQAQGGMQPQQQQPTMQQAQGGATPPPPPPPPPPAPSMAQAQAPSAPQPTMAQAQQQQPVAQPSIAQPSMAQAQQPVAQPSMADAQAPVTQIQQPSMMEAQSPAVSVQQNLPGTVQGTPQVQQNLPGSVQGAPQVQQNMPGTVQGEPQVQQNLPGTVQGIPQVQQNMPGTVQGDDLATTLAEDINRQYTEGMLPAVSQRDQINQMYEEGMRDRPAVDQREDINRQYEEAFGGAPLQTTPTDIAGAGADMAAAQNVVTPEAAPMPGTLEEALRQQYMSRVGGTDDPILASQLADQQMRQNEARKALVEQLGRYGVLRGGGDTAAALARMGEGDERNRLALEAQAAQRRQQDLRDAQGFDLGQRGMGLQEDRFDQDRLTQELAREVTEAGQTGQFRGGQTMAGQRQEADIFGEVDGRQTLQSDIQRGQLGLGERQTGLQERTGAEDIRRSAAQRGAIAGQEGRAERQLESQLFGEVDGRQTLTGETTRSGLDTQDLQRRIAEAGQTGLFDQEIEGVDPIQTQQARALQSELETAALGRDATRAGLTGMFDEAPTLEAELRRAGLTGFMGQDQYDEEGNLIYEAPRTLAGRAEEMDRVGAMLAAADAGVIGENTAQQAVIDALNLTKRDDARNIVTEEERLQRKYPDLSANEANTMNLLMADNPDLSEEDALEIMRRIGE